MTEIRFSIVVNVPESGSHVRCCETRSKSSCSPGLLHTLPVDVLGQHFRFVPADNARH